MDVGGIGRLNESSIHADLKELYLTEGGRSEVPVDGYIADIAGWRGRIVEIQTARLGTLKRKLAALLAGHRVRLAYPIAVEKELIVGEAGGRVLYRRKSPKRGALLDVVYELVGVAGLLAHPRFELEVLLTREQEIRRRDGSGSWRRGGAAIVDRRLVELLSRHLFRGPADYRALLPDGCPPRFTHQQLAALLGVPVDKARRVSYCLRAAGVLRVHSRGPRGFLLEQVEGGQT